MPRIGSVGNLDPGWYYVGAEVKASLRRRQANFVGAFMTLADLGVATADLKPSEDCRKPRLLLGGRPQRRPTCRYGCGSYVFPAHKGTGVVSKRQCGQGRVTAPWSEAISPGRVARSLWRRAVVDAAARGQPGDRRVRRLDDSAFVPLTGAENVMASVRFRLLAALAASLIGATIMARPARLWLQNLLRNGDFSEGSGNLPSYWYSQEWIDLPTTTFRWIPPSGGEPGDGGNRK